MSKFKEGDRVRAVKNCSIGNFKKGQTGTIVATDEDFDCNILFDDGTKGYVQYEDEEIELIEEKTTNKLRFGHRVIAWNDRTPEKKGRYVSSKHENTYPHCVLVDDKELPQNFKFVKLDPDATEFLPGDEVEYRLSPDDGWENGTYGYKNTEGHRYIRKPDSKWSFHVLTVRYPQPEPTLREQLDEAIQGGARCILINLETVEQVSGDVYRVKYENEALFFTQLKYKDVPICITDTAKNFEVKK